MFSQITNTDNHKQINWVSSQTQTYAIIYNLEHLYIMFKGYTGTELEYSAYSYYTLDTGLQINQ